MKGKCKREISAIGEARFSLILPKRDNAKHPIRPKILKEYISKVNKIFKGSTTVPVTKGCYFYKDKLQCENGFEITAVRDFQSKYTPELKKYTAQQRRNKLINDYVRLKKIAKEAGEQFGQESIMVVSDHINDATFVPGT